MSFRKHPEISTEVLQFVAAPIEQALRQASASLTEHCVRHAICGGLAVGAYGHVRATRDVDFLVGDEAFLKTGGLLTFAPGVPYKIGNILTDMVSMDKGMQFMEEELRSPYDFDGMPIVSPECLVTMKLIAFRRRDRDDIVAILNAGSTTLERCSTYLYKHGRDDLVERLERL